MPWYFGFGLAILVAIIASASRAPVPPTYKQKVHRPWWYSQDQWDASRGYTEAEYAAWRKIQRRKEKEFEVWKDRMNKRGK
jgi:hypothetical protein